MSSILIPLFAALGGSALTGLVAFGLEWWRTSRLEKSAQSERRIRAYSVLLARSFAVAHYASDIHTIMEIRSGLMEGISVTLGMQKAVDAIELEDKLRTELQPLYQAWSEAWVVGSKEAIPVANDLVSQCGFLMGTASQRGEARPELLRRLLGEKWTQQQLDDWQNKVQGLALARKRLAEIARREAGVEVADLFASNEAKPSSKT